jgi:hypothetical protein
MSGAEPLIDSRSMIPRLEVYRVRHDRSRARLSGGARIAFGLILASACAPTRDGIGWRSSSPRHRLASIEEVTRRTACDHEQDPITLYDPWLAELRHRGPAAGTEAVATVLAQLRAGEDLGGRPTCEPMKLFDVVVEWRGRGLLEELRAWVRDPRPALELRAAAAFALGSLGDRDSAGDIVALLDQGERPWRATAAAARALGLLRHADAVPALARGLGGALDDEGTPSMFFVLAALEALGRIDIEPAWTAIRAAARHGSAQARTRVLQGLEAVDRDPAIELLVAGLDDPDALVRGAACRALLEPVSRPRPRFQPLEDHLRAAGVEVRCHPPSGPIWDALRGGVQEWWGSRAPPPAGRAAG